EAAPLVGDARADSGHRASPVRRVPGGPQAGAVRRASHANPRNSASHTTVRRTIARTLSTATAPPFEYSHAIAASTARLSTKIASAASWPQPRRRHATTPAAMYANPIAKL